MAEATPQPGPPGPGEDVPKVREAVGIFDTFEALQDAVDDLSLHGFSRETLSLMADDATIKARLGETYQDIGEAKDDPRAPRIAYVAPEEVGDAAGMAIGLPAYVGAIIAGGAILATGGTLLAGALAAAAGGLGGGAIGSRLARWIGHRHGQLLQDHPKKGGLLLWVNLRDAEQERQAREILARHTPHPVEVHELPSPVTSREGI